MLDGAPVVPVVFSPSDLSGLLLWLEGDGGTFQDSAGTIAAAAAGDVVGLWTDRSGNVSNAVQATTAQKPVLEAGPSSGTFGIRFDGGQGMATGITAAIGDFTAFVCFRDRNGPASFERLIDKNYASGFWVGRSATGSDLMGGGIRQTSSPFGLFVAASDSSRHVIMHRRGGTTQTVRADADAASLQTCSGLATDSTTPLQIGVDSAGAGRLGGTIYAVLLYNRSLTDTDAAKVESYLATKWGV